MGWKISLPYWWLFCPWDPDTQLSQQQKELPATAVHGTKPTSRFFCCLEMDPLNTQLRACSFDLTETLQENEETEA